jgi:hypothetical protein
MDHKISHEYPETSVSARGGPPCLAWESLGIFFGKIEIQRASLLEPKRCDPDTLPVAILQENRKEEFLWPK